VPKINNNGSLFIEMEASARRRCACAGLQVGVKIWTKKNRSKERFFRMWSAREDDSPLRGFALRAVAEATFSRCARVEPPSPELLILVKFQTKKNRSKERFFRMWSAREDSNLRPTGPKPVALPSCATRRMRSASYCCDATPSIPFPQKPH
jgi:hypothetical protein